MHANADGKATSRAPTAASMPAGMHGLEAVSLLHARAHYSCISVAACGVEQLLEVRHASPRDRQLSAPAMAACTSPWRRAGGILSPGAPQVALGRTSASISSAPCCWHSASTNAMRRSCRASTGARRTPRCREVGEDVCVTRWASASASSLRRKTMHVSTAKTEPAAEEPSLLFGR